MNGPLNDLIEALREELRQYGEMLARFDDQVEDVSRNASAAALDGAALLHDQSMAIEKARRRREEAQRELAGQLRLAKQGSLTEVVPWLPQKYQPLMRALVEECHRLPQAIERRIRQNRQLTAKR
ncbi:hypothetical protein SBV1_660018 [Verrucomicrobia bacterium]|nr:hypothetical protein SBV1_660018 [Verrucomicrobiota bacterium]